jgi:hypothetical protein
VRARAAATGTAETLERALTCTCSQVRAHFLPTERLCDRFFAEQKLKEAIAKGP